MLDDIKKNTINPGSNFEKVSKNVHDARVDDFILHKKFDMTNRTHTAVGLEYCPGGEIFMLLKAKKKLVPAEA